MANDITTAKKTPDPHRNRQITACITLDDELLRTARAYAGIHDVSALIGQALKYLVEREASRRLARLHGYAPGLSDLRATGTDR